MSLSHSSAPCSHPRSASRRVPVSHHSLRRAAGPRFPRGERREQGTEARETTGDRGLRRDYIGSGLALSHHSSIQPWNLGSYSRLTVTCFLGSLPLPHPGSFLTSLSLRVRWTEVRNGWVSSHMSLSLFSQPFLTSHTRSLRSLFHLHFFYFGLH